jgi:uncharacterized protein YbjT (DUF2867 family)
VATKASRDHDFAAATTLCRKPALIDYFGQESKVTWTARQSLTTRDPSFFVHQPLDGEPTVKIVVIGGTGLIGSKVASNLRRNGHEVIAAAPNSGVNTITGEGLSEALAGANVVVDVANSPSFADDAVMAFFTTSGRNLLLAESEAGVRHHVALSVVGAERLPDNGYLRAKLAQEELIKLSGIPYTIVRSTQFFEFIDGIADASTQSGVVRVSPAHVQPVASDDVAALVAKVATMAPMNGTIELAGPEPISLDDLLRRYLQAKRDPRSVVAEVRARYFGSELNDKSLTPGDNPHIGATSFDSWFSRSAAH